jgi:hypothetical protein
MTTQATQQREDSVWRLYGAMADSPDHEITEGVAEMMFRAILLYVAHRHGTRELAERLYRAADAWAVADMEEKPFG